MPWPCKGRRSFWTGHNRGGRRANSICGCSKPALDNAVYMAAVHFPFSDIGQRSYVIDPYGYPLAASHYWLTSVFSADVDLDAGRVWFASSDVPGTAGQKGYLAGYYPKTIPESALTSCAVLFAGRRPELYRPIVEKTLADRDFPPETYKRMMEPR